MAVKNKPKMSRQAAIAASVLASYLRPKLAEDAKINLLSILDGVTAKNFSQKKPSILDGLKKQFKISPAHIKKSGKTPKLAMDATIGEVAELLDMIENHGVEGDNDDLMEAPGAMQEIGNPRAEVAPEMRNEKEAGLGHDDPIEEVKQLLAGKVDEATLMKVCELMEGGGVHEHEPENALEAEGEEKEEKEPMPPVKEKKPLMEEKSEGETEEKAHDAEGGEEKLKELGAADNLEEDANSGKGTGTGEGSPGGGPSSAEDSLEEDANSGKGTGTGEGSPGGGSKGAKDEPPPFKGMPKTGGKMVTQDAMNAAIKAERKRAQDVRDAEREVRAWVGDLNMAFDSAGDVYKTALTMLGQKDIDKVDPSAYPTILKLIPKPGTRMVGTNVMAEELAMDSAADETSYDEMFPDAARIGIM